MAVDDGEELRSSSIFTFTITGEPVLEIRSWDEFQTINERANTNVMGEGEGDAILLQEAGIGVIRNCLYWGGDGKCPDDGHFCANGYYWKSGMGMLKARVRPATPSCAFAFPSHGRMASRTEMPISEA